MVGILAMGGFLFCDFFYFHTIANNIVRDQGTKKPDTGYLWFFIALHPRLSFLHPDP
jgi:hypothetical protein